MSKSSIVEIINDYKTRLVDIYTAREAANITFIVTKKLSNYSRTEYAIHKKIIVDEEKQAEYHRFLNRLLKHEPVQYVLGETEFLGLTLKVNKHVLIPRPETEELVLWIVDDINAAATSPKKILDIGTGSGCIAIGLKHNLANVEVDAMDKFSKALEIAEKNAKSNKQKINFFASDLLSDDPLPVSYKYDLIVCNPPYIPSYERDLLELNVIKYEPHAALFTNSDDPLIYYKAVINLCNKYLKYGRPLYFEVNENMAGEVADLMNKYNFEEIEITKDLSGKERMVRGEKQKKAYERLN
ncbi:MAG: peptide chain release factor N(5)-glutamine methyltransferase [Bacteroidetes bacterium]|nr:peptide chain release factor N(5)-glutamine methyltransferase [Bacteroidota bacterium]